MDLLSCALPLTASRPLQLQQLVANRKRKPIEEKVDELTIRFAALYDFRASYTSTFDPTLLFPAHEARRDVVH